MYRDPGLNSGPDNVDEDLNAQLGVKKETESQAPEIDDSQYLNRGDFPSSQKPQLIISFLLQKRTKK